MSTLESGGYKIEISDEYESEEIERYGDTFFEVKQRDAPGHSALIFFGWMPINMATPRDLCISKDVWPTLRDAWLHGECHPCDAKRLLVDSWYEVTAGNIRRIVHDLDGIVTLNFVSKVDGDDASVHRFLKDLADTTKVEKKKSTSE